MDSATTHEVFNQPAPLVDYNLFETNRALREALKLNDRLVFLDFITDQKENVFPMVPGGKGLTEMILAEEL